MPKWDDWIARWPGLIHLAYSPAQSAEALEAAAQWLGPAWLEHYPEGVGTLPALNPIIAGRVLRALHGRTPPISLIARLKRRDSSAWAELEVIYLLTRQPKLKAEFEPAAETPSGIRRPEFRVRIGRDRWTYCEVMQPRPSDSYETVQRLLDTWLEANADLPGKAFLDVALKRPPKAADIEALRASLGRTDKKPGTTDLGLPDDAGQATFSLEADPEARTALLRYVVPDLRAEQLMRRKSAQLHSGSPGLIVLDIGQIATNWKGQIAASFDAGEFPWVSGALLFQSGMMNAPEGEGWLLQGRLVTNLRATHPLPPALVTHLEAISGETFDHTLP